MHYSAHIKHVGYFIFSSNERVFHHQIYSLQKLHIFLLLWLQHIVDFTFILSTVLPNCTERISSTNLISKFATLRRGI